MNIRDTKPDDVSDLQRVLDATELFPGEMLPAMLSGFLNDTAHGDIWLTCEADGRAQGFCYAAPEKLTDGTWNMLAIAVHPSRQANGMGAALVRHLEDTLRDRGQRILIVDTSGAQEFDRTRAFYRKNGYTEEARIRDFWAAGSDKIVFWKRLA